MDSNKLQSCFSLVRQSSRAPDRDDSITVDAPESVALNPTVRLMYLANEGDLEAINELLDDGCDVNFRDIDGRTALHIAACQGRTDVVQLLIQRGAEVDPQDRWCSTVMQCNAIVLAYIFLVFGGTVYCIDYWFVCLCNSLLQMRCTTKIMILSNFWSNMVQNPRFVSSFQLFSRFELTFSAYKHL